MENEEWENDHDYDHHEAVLDFCPPPDGDYELISYFCALLSHPEVLFFEDVDCFVAQFGKKRIGEGRTPAEAIRNCLMPERLI